MTSVTRQVGVVSAVDADRIQACARPSEYDSLRANWSNVLQCNTQGNKGYWSPDVEEQIEVLPDANDEDGVILDAVYSDVSKPPFGDKNIRGTRFADGTECSYNRKTHTLVIQGGIKRIVIECGADVVLKTQKATTDALGTELTGDLRVKGKLIYEGGMTGSGDEGVTVIIHGNTEIKGSAHATGSTLSDSEDSSHHFR